MLSTWKLVEIHNTYYLMENGKWDPLLWCIQAFSILKISPSLLAKAQTSHSIFNKVEKTIFVLLYYTCTWWGCFCKTLFRHNWSWRSWGWCPWDVDEGHSIVIQHPDLPWYFLQRHLVEFLKNIFWLCQHTCHCIPWKFVLLKPFNSWNSVEIFNKKLKKWRKNLKKLKVKRT